MEEGSKSKSCIKKKSFERKMTEKELQKVKLKAQKFAKKLIKKHPELNSVLIDLKGHSEYSEGEFVFECK